MPRVSEEEIHRFAVNVLTTSGLSGEQAEATASGLVVATKRGITTHGMFRLPQYSESIRGGKINAAATVRQLGRRGCTALIDGDGGYGFLPTSVAMDQAIDIAREHGIALVGVRNSHHFGAAAIYSRRAAKVGLIGIVSTTTKARIAPTGTVGAVVGNNPLSIAVPRRPPHSPIVLDMALSQVAMGRLRIAAAGGRQIPLGWGYDAEGRPTTDPNAVLNGGLLAPIGEHKGYGLSVMIEILAGVMTGSPFGLFADNHDHPKGGVGHITIAIAPDFMRDMDAFYDDLETLVEQIKGSPPAAGSTGALLPGEIEDRKAAEASRDGLLISDELAGQLIRLAESLAIDPPRWLT